VTRFVRVLRDYRVTRIVGDRYAGETFRSQFVAADVAYAVSTQTTSELYEALEPRLNAGHIVLLDVPTLEQQLLGLVWKPDATWRVWQAATRVMNPSVPESFIAKAYADDPTAAAAEFGAQFRSDVESFVAREVVEACIVPKRYELEPQRGVRYCGFVDSAGGSGGDSMTLQSGTPSPAGLSWMR
jgi:hypothetical protein